MVAQTVTGTLVSVGCKSGDTFVKTFRDWIRDPTGGAAVLGAVCKDHLTHGNYWSVEVEDTAEDGKCAHAVAIWRQQNDQDYGMYVCGLRVTGHFYTPVRDWAEYSSTDLGAFVDAGSARTGLSYDFANE